jgi:hypothetical protein
MGSESDFHFWADGTARDCSGDMLLLLLLPPPPPPPPLVPKPDYI